ncbi:MAG: DUF6293 family protein [Methanomassiliicoccaceae archaeon]|nr:DUF6293 family protein [Methanomassiliicoccaceae archaeon]
MASGKRERIMISCVTFETVKITEPVRFYDIDRVHLIHYIRDPKSYDGTVYQEFFDEVCKIIKKNSDNRTEIKEYEEKISRFLPMLKLILNIIEKEFASNASADIYVNISAGTSEYTAAAVVAAMMNPSVIPFSVSTDEYTVKDDMIRNAYYRNGVPVGLTESIFEPMMMPKYNMPMPDRNLVLGLRILNDLNKIKRNSKGPEVIMKLKENGLWRRSDDNDITSDNKGNKQYDTSPEKSDSVHYHRDFVSKWLLNEWIIKDDFRKRYYLTDEGKRIVETFYTG